MFNDLPSVSYDLKLLLIVRLKQPRNPSSCSRIDDEQSQKDRHGVWLSILMIIEG